MTKAKTRSAINMDAFRNELTGLVPADFLRRFSAEQMTSARRYCKALQIRMERAYVSPEKDKMKAAQLTPYTKRLQELKPRDPSPACLQALQEYRSMLEEYKISLFAQEMKTLFPVSSKRLDKKWRELKGLG